MFAVVIALLMAFLHDAAVGLFGFGASKLGDLGVSVGYTVFMAFSIMIGNLNGFLTGEWKNAGKKALRWIYAGILLLVVAVCILGTSNGLDTLNKQSETPPVQESIPSTTEIDSGVMQEQVVQE
jgi:L-rhamnose-proton symport protein (RhaT).